MISWLVSDKVNIWPSASASASASSAGDTDIDLQGGWVVGMVRAMQQEPRMWWCQAAAADAMGQGQVLAA
jgi:hypothetical protein